MAEKKVAKTAEKEALTKEALQSKLVYKVWKDEKKPSVVIKFL